MKKIKFFFDTINRQLSVFSVIVFLLIGINFLSCKKEGLGGKATIQGKVLHHDTPIPGALVYIKYGAKELPGTNATDYNQTISASLLDASYQIENLRAGDYYIYSVGFDSAIMEEVKGGVPIKIKSKKETVEKNVPVTE